MNRRTYLATGTALATTATAGCLGTLLGGSPRAPPTVADRPDAVYVPSHVEGMKMVATKSAGQYRVGLFYSFPHRFWTVTGSRTQKVAIQDGDSVHLMASAWDPESRRVVPVGNARTEVTKGGEQVTGKPLWPMLSQNMGFHFGDNVALEGKGTYEVTVQVDPPGAVMAGDFAGRFDEQANATVTMAYSKQKRNEITFRQFDERAGKKRAVAPMDMEMLPLSRVPERKALPGKLLGQGTSGDAVFYAKVLESPPRGIDGEGPYLLVSPRTPYNRYPLPLMSVVATVARDGSTVFDDGLSAVLHPEAGYHYGAALPSLQSGDEVTLSPGAPPQVARHEGYETAFLDMGDVSMTV